MRSTFAGLNTVVRGIYANQASLDTVGHNVTNAGTDGYSRQQVGLVSSRPENIYGGNGMIQVGTGVTVQSVTRVRDSFLDQRYWKENSSLGYGDSVNSYLGKIEGVFSEPSDTGIQTVLDKFWKAIQTVGSNASDPGSRTALRQRGVEMVDAIKQAETQLTDMVGDMNSVLDIKVGKINQISSEMLSLNKQIMSAEATGSTANDLRDRRDNLVDQLSTLTKVNVYEDKSGSYIVQIPGVMLVNGERTTTLRTASDDEAALTKEYGLKVLKVETAETPPQKVNFAGGEIGGLLEARDSDVQGIKAYLDNINTLAKSLLTDFNQIHREGYGLDNSTGQNFFGGNTAYTDANGAITLTSGTWLKELKVNDALFDTVNGGDKIAAKTLAGNVSVTQSNTAGGAGSLSNIVFPSGSAATKILVRVTSVNAGTGQITGADVSMDGGSVWSPATVNHIDPTNPGSDSYIDLTSGVVAARLTIKTDVDNKAPSGTPLVYNTYTVQLPQGNAAGDNAVRLAQFLKMGAKDPSVTKDSAVMGTATYKAALSDKSYEAYYNSMTGALGVQKQSAQRLTDNQQSLVDQVDGWRESNSGVNMDEELSNMIKFQKGYNSAARILTAMDEMLDKLINSTGVVGR